MDKLAEVKLAAFVDELVKIAFDREDPSLLMGVVGMLNDDQVEMLKHAGMWDAIKGVTGRAGKAIGEMGERGAARRMATAGAAHDVEKANLGRLQQLMHGPTAMKLEGAAPTHMPGAGFTSSSGQFIHAPSAGSYGSRWRGSRRGA